MSSRRFLAPIFRSTQELVDVMRGMNYSLVDFSERAEGTPLQLHFGSAETPTGIDLALDSAVDLWCFHINGPDADRLAAQVESRIRVMTAPDLNRRLAATAGEARKGVLRFAALLARDGQFSKIRDAVGEALRDADPGVREQAMLVLGHAESKEAAEVAREVLQEEKDPALRAGLELIAREFAGLLDQQ